MKALVAQSYGPLEDLVVTEMPKPVPGPGQILVRTEASAVNAADAVLVTGVMKDVLPVQHPFTPGVDISGIVEAVGEGVTRFVVGDPVLAWLGLPSGALAEYVLVEDAPSVAIRPVGLDAAHAAALATGGLTASSLVNAAKVTEGETVLVIGAAGGVGSYVVQLAKQAGATVLATGRAEDAAYLKRLAADEVLDYKSVNIPEETRRRVPGGVDVVIDVAHVSPDLAEAAVAVKSGGRVIYVLGGPPPALDRGVSATYAGAEAPEGRLGELAAQAADGRLRVEVSANYPFASARQALVDFTTQHVRGKITVTF
ncbi:NADP-dependent oxidoreductase [Streptomyces sp. NPDC059460]|uniref:NADP-dependent oxidoreductase n=1 Tax=Streptomyces sp. NPDC059460 TaxID=3346840 RepID=UPI0036B70B74